MLGTKERKLQVLIGYQLVWILHKLHANLASQKLRVWKPEIYVHHL